MLVPLGVRAQSSPFDEAGRFYTQNFAPEDYGAHVQNWAIVQDKRGLLYVANGDGVLEYDGVSWRLIPISNGITARSLAIDQEGRIYVGAVDELGYLAPDSLGQMHYVSLLEHIPEEDRNFSIVWKTFVLPEGVYFQSYDRIFRWREGRMKVWKPETRFFTSHVVRDTFYVHAWEQELRYMDRDTLRLAPGGTTFSGQRIYGLVPHGADAYLVITRGHGIFRCRSTTAIDENCARFSPGLTDLLATLQPYRATVLPDESIAIGTIRGGLVLLDQAGRLQRHLNEASGLPHELVTYPYVDQQGGLWLGLAHGLTHIEVGALVSYFDKTTGLKGSVNSVARHRGRLYAASDLGVYALIPATEEEASHFVETNVIGQCWSLLSTPQGLLAGCFHGIFNVEEGRVVWPLQDRHVFKLYRSPHDTTRLYLGLQDGLAQLTLRDGVWQDTGRLDTLQAMIRSFAEDAEGRLWMGTPTSGVFRLEAETTLSDATRIRQFGVADGLPAGWIHTRTLAGRVLLLSDVGDGLFQVETNADAVRFVPDTTFDAFLPEDSGRINDLAEDDQGRVWISAGTASGVARPTTEGGYTFTATALRRTPIRDAYVTEAEPEGAVWIGGPHGLVRLDAANAAPPPLSYSAWIRRITTTNDALVFAGQPITTESPAWPYRNNALRFAYAAPRYDASERTQYRTRLDGFDDAWSTWKAETYEDYTNLSEGHYVFHVQARDVYGLISEEAAFDFRILPPWYRTWWAWMLYGLIASGLIWSGYHLRTQSLRQRNQRLSQEIEQRKKAERKMEAQNTELERKNAELERYAYTVSHDLKNPLVTISGFLGLLHQDAVKGDLERVHHDINIIDKATQKMRRLLDDLLDLSRVGQVINPPSAVLLFDLAHEAAQQLDLALRTRGVTIIIDETMPQVHGDDARLLEVYVNLIENAIKFMGEQPEPRIEVGARQQDDAVICHVRDNGIGIEADYQTLIFGLFERLDQSIEGTGVGLALVKRIVEAHGGRVWVESAGLEQGSTFFFTLPTVPLPTANPASALP